MTDRVDATVQRVQPAVGDAVQRDPAGEDVYLYDRRVRRSTILTVRSRGGRRPRERTPQLLRRASVADDAKVVAFSTTAPLARGDSDRLEDVVLRRTAPPATRIVSGPSGVVHDSRVSVPVPGPLANFTVSVSRRRGTEPPSDVGTGRFSSVVRSRRLGHPVLAVVRGTAVNQDGASNGIMSPNGLAQEDLIKQVFARYQIDAASIGYMEAHGSGTELASSPSGQAAPMTPPSTHGV